MKRILFFIFLISTLRVFAQPQSPEIPIGPDQVFIQGTANNEIKIMSYNVLNLFDADKDISKDDWIWLPKNFPGRQQYCKSLPNPKDQQYCNQFDWTYEKINWKLNQIKKVVDFQGSKPDIMTVVEVENENVLRLLAAKLGYKNYIITNGPDQRGIDVGLMFNMKPGFTFVHWEAIHVSFKTQHAGRDILRVDFTWNNKPFSVYVNHWPSQRNPIQERVACAQFLAQNIDAMVKTAGPNWSAVAVGDFNTLDSEKPNAFRDIVHNERWNNFLFDAELYARQSKLNPSLPYIPPGTFYYVKDDIWSRLDRIAVTKNLIDQKEMEFAQESYRILFPQFMSFNFKRFNNGSQDRSPLSPMKSPMIGQGGQTPDPSNGGKFRYIRIPIRYDFDTLDISRRGYSDHLPVVFKLRMN